ncbi:MAG: GDSL-type esterase/lipase family protein [Anaerolineae bacterium]|jgi:lysophospholipase L1-like esterase|nr:GDSL-type esterase/lipase family protein [Anaerolineae bacterium]
MPYYWIALIAIAAIGLCYLAYRIYGTYQAKREDPERWEKEIKKIESRYGEYKPTGRIVFLGSSSIRLWETLEEDMAPFDVLNHGFGGSKAVDSTYYLNRLVNPFKPRALVIFTGTNDINGIKGNTKSGEQVFFSVINLIETYHELYPQVPIFYISITPTPSRWKVWRDADTTNQLVARYAEKNPYLTLIDTTEAFINTDGKPKRSLFQRDQLHLNEKGYALWTSLIKPVLEEKLNQ